MVVLILFWHLIRPDYSFAYTLKIVFENLESSQGSIKFLVFNKSEGYPDLAEKSFIQRTIPISEAQKGIELELPESIYAVTAIHDSNDNDKLDTNFLGLPKEGFGFSNNPRIYFGPPSFKRSSFKLKKPSDLIIQMKYL